MAIDFAAMNARNRATTQAQISRMTATAASTPRTATRTNAPRESASAPTSTPAKDESHLTALQLAQSQLNNDMERMKVSSSFRAGESQQAFDQANHSAGRDFNYQTATANQQSERDFNYRQAENASQGDRDFNYRTAERRQGAEQDFNYRTAEAGQQFDYRTKGATQDSDLRMREGQQSYGFQSALQKDNNDVRERMQAGGFNQEKDMLNLRDRMDQDKTRGQALRSSMAWRGKI